MILYCSTQLWSLSPRPTGAISTLDTHGHDFLPETLSGTHLPRIWISCPTHQSLLFSLLFWLLFLQPLHAGEPQVLVFSLFFVHSHYLGNLILSYRQIQINIPMTPQGLSTGLTSSLNESTCLFQLSTCLHLRQFRLSTFKNELTFPPNQL